MPTCKQIWDFFHIQGAALVKPAIDLSNKVSCYTSDIRRQRSRIVSSIWDFFHLLNAALVKPGLSLIFYLKFLPSLQGFIRKSSNGNCGTMAPLPMALGQLARQANLLLVEIGKYAIGCAMSNQQWRPPTTAQFTFLHCTIRLCCRDLCSNGPNSRHGLEEQ